MRARLFIVFLLAAAGLLSHASASADVLRCNDAKGNTLYTDSACPAGMRTVGSTPMPPACATEECDRRRERELKEASDRVRADKEQLAAMTAERHKREIEERRLDEARYEAELRSVAAMPAAAEEVVYPVYPLYGYPGYCGRRCFPRPKPVGHRHDHMQGPGGHRDMRTAGSDSRRARPRTSGRVMRDGG